MDLIHKALRISFRKQSIDLQLHDYVADSHCYDVLLRLRAKPKYTQHPRLLSNRFDRGASAPVSHPHDYWISQVSQNIMLKSLHAFLAL